MTHKKSFADFINERTHADIDASGRIPYVSGQSFYITPDDIAGYITEADSTYSGIQTFNIGSLLDKGSYVFDIRAYGALIDGSTDDSSAVAAAITAMGSTPGKLYLPPGTTVINTAIALAVTGMDVIGVPGESFISTTLTSSNSRGVFTISNKNSIGIYGVGFIINGSSTAITSYGHNDLHIVSCSFTGVSTTPGAGVISLAGGASPAVADMDNTLIEKCKFYDLTGTNARTIHLYPRNGYTIDNLTVRECIFENAAGPLIHLDAYDLITNVTIERNRIKNPRQNTLSAAFVLTRVTEGLVNNLVIDKNIYTNTDTSVNEGYFASTYSVDNVRVTNNTAIGACDNDVAEQGPFLAPGRTDYPQKGLIIAGNYIEGFNSAYDADSMTNTEVYGNVVVRCGGTFGFGYSFQYNCNVHDNIFYNCRVSNSAYFTMVGFGSSDTGPLMCSFTNNVFIDDRSLPAPTSPAATTVVGGSLTSLTTYYYIVTSVDYWGGESTASSEISATTDANKKTVRLTWNKMPGAVNYKIYRSTTSGVYGASSFLSATVGQRRTYDDTGSTSLSSGSPPSVSTTRPTYIDYGVMLFGQKDFSSVVVTGNRFYMPYDTFTSYVYLENDTEVRPRVFKDNVFEDLTGIWDGKYKNLGNISGAITFNYYDGSTLAATLTGSITVTLTDGVIAGDTLTLILTQDGTGGWTATWPSNFKKVGGTLALSAAAGAVDVIEMSWDGTNWREVSRSMGLA